MRKANDCRAFYGRSMRDTMDRFLRISCSHPLQIHQTHYNVPPDDLGKHQNCGKPFCDFNATGEKIELKPRSIVNDESVKFNFRR